MRKDLSHLDGGLICGNTQGEQGGCWRLQRHSQSFAVIASWGMDWDHVSVSTPHRCPSWDEMCWIKDLFFEADETVIQYHPRKDDYVNCHEYCLHMWRPQNVELPAPPLEMIA